MHRLEACLDRADGQPIRILQSATLLTDPANPTAEALVEHVILGGAAGPDTAELRAQRLEAVGALATEMTPEMEALVTALHERVSADTIERREVNLLAGQVAALVRQLGAFSRRQMASASRVDLKQVVLRAEPTLLRLLGDYIAFSTELEDTAFVAAHVDNLDHLLTSLVTLGRDLLPAGGSILVETHPRASGEAANGEAATGPQLLVSASGYGVQIPERALALELVVERAGGQLRIHGEPGWLVRLEVSFPRCGKLQKSRWHWME